MANEVELKSQARELAAEVKSTIEAGDLTPAQKSERLDKLEAASADIGTELKNLSRGRALMTGADVSEEDAAAAEGKNFVPQSIAQSVLNDPGFKGIQAMAKAGARYTHSMEIGAKAQGAANLLGENATGTTAGTAVGSNLFLGGNAGPSILPNFLPGIVDQRFYPLTIADLFAAGSTDSPVISYVAETAFTNASAATGEGTTKPYSNDTIARLQEQVGKVSNAFKITDEMIQDAAQYVSFLQGRLILGVQRQEEVQVLAGNGYPGVNGLLARTNGFADSGSKTTAASVLFPAASTPGAGVIGSTVTTVKYGRTVSTYATGAVTGDFPTAVATAEAIFQAVTDIRFGAFVEPDAVVMHPLDWQNIRLAKDAQGQYLGGSFFGADYGQGQNAGHTLWGLRVVVTPAIPRGSVLVGGFREAGQLFRRQGLTVESTNSNGTDFEQGLVTVRADSRLGLAVYRPGAFELIQLIPHA